MTEAEYYDRERKIDLITTDFAVKLFKENIVGVLEANLICSKSKRIIREFDESSR